jgi:hypothetical protein
VVTSIWLLVPFDAPPSLVESEAVSVGGGTCLLSVEPLTAWLKDLTGGAGGMGLRFSSDCLFASIVANQKVESSVDSQIKFWWVSLHAYSQAVLAERMVEVLLPEPAVVNLTVTAGSYGNVSGQKDGLYRGCIVEPRAIECSNCSMKETSQPALC